MISAQIVSSGQSYVGTLRADNQDSFRICEPDDDQTRRSFGCLYAVADGMGGYQYGDIASAQAIKTFFETFYSGKGAKSAKNLQRAVHAANLAVYQLAQLLDRARLGTTLSAVNLAGDRLYLAHVGDSRVYLIRDRQATCLTRDHTKVGDLVALRALSPDKVRTHASRSELNRSIGTGLFVQPDIRQLALHAGDAIVLCSDGMWSVIEDDEFAELAYDIEKPRDLGQVLMDIALKRDSDDNLSLVAIRIEHLVQDTASAEKRRRLHWSGVLRRQV
jgi:protein phosphatase